MSAKLFRYPVETSRAAEYMKWWLRDQGYYLGDLVAETADWSKGAAEALVPECAAAYCHADHLLRESLNIPGEVSGKYLNLPPSEYGRIDVPLNPGDELVSELHALLNEPHRYLLLDNGLGLEHSDDPHPMGRWVFFPELAADASRPTPAVCSLAGRSSEARIAAAIKDMGVAWGLLMLLCEGESPHQGTDVSMIVRSARSLILPVFDHDGYIQWSF